MTVTRDVIYDLLPAYFAGEVSADTRALLEEFFAGDPEFGRMAERFRTLMQERPRDDAARRETTAFDRARARVKFRLAAGAWGLGAVFAVEKPSHMNGVNTLSIQFFDRAGAAALKVFFNFGGKPTPERETRFQDMRERFVSPTP